MAELAKILNFDNGEEFTPDFEIIKKKKNVVNNQKSKRFVEPLRNKEDIKKIVDWCESEIANSKTPSKRNKNLRYLTIFKCGINWGLRVSDLLSVKWGDVFESDMETFKWETVYENGIEMFQTYGQVKEKKTGKIKKIFLNTKVKEALVRYIAECELKPKADECIFASGKVDKDGSKLAITDASVEKFIKAATNGCGIEGNFNTHSMRKTFAYQIYIKLANANDPLALPTVQSLLNHKNQSDTLRYLGLQQERELNISEALELF